MTGSIYKEEEMADPLGNFVPEFIEKEVERESIVNLARLVTDRIPQKLSKVRRLKELSEMLQSHPRASPDSADKCIVTERDL